MSLRVVGSLLVLSPILLGPAVAIAATSGVQMTVSQSTANPLMLDVTLTNGTDRSIEVPNFRLPWGDRYSMVVIALNPSVQRHALSAVEQPSPPLASGTTVIEPGQAVAGQINLVEYVDGIWKQMSASDVTLVWRYDVPAGDRASSATRLNGRLLLARTGAPK